MTRVLVVNHDIDMADIEIDQLRRAGYEVDQCRGPVGGDACPVLNGQTCWQVEKADVLVYDVWATGDGAADLINDLRDMHPNKPVVLTSPGLMMSWAETGGPHEVTPVDWVESGGDLASAVEEALRRGAVPRKKAKPAPAAELPQARPANSPRW